MVNVGGRSKGCSTCRKRRVKCDEHRPICRRCQRWNLECDGPRGITFIAGHDTRHAIINVQNLPEKEHAAKGPTPTEAQVMLYTSPRVAGYDVYICYTQAALLANGLIVSSMADMKSVDIVPAGPGFVNGRVSHQALLSLATILFGTQHQQADIISEGYSMHGVALHQLNEALSDPASQASDDVIVAVAALSISELFNPSWAGSYQRHVLGLERLIDLQDPISFWSRNSRGFCEGVRFMILLTTIQLEKASILARSDWKQAMRLNSSPKELQEQDLFDVLADCTVLFARRHIMSGSWHVSMAKAIRQRDEIWLEAQNLLAQLYAWRSRWYFASGEKLEQSLTALPEVQDDSVALMMMLYNLVLIYVVQILASLPFEEPLNQSGPQACEPADTFSQLTRARARSIEREAARNACRCLRYYMGRNTRLDMSKPPIIHWVMTTVWTKLRQDDSEEGRWMRDLLTNKARQVIAQGMWSTYKWLDSLPN